MTIDSNCACAVTLDGLVELAHPSCNKHSSDNRRCPLHDGDWAGYQCERHHDETCDILLAEIIRIRAAAIDFGWRAATHVAIFGSAFIQVTRRPGEPNEVKLLDPTHIYLHYR